MVERTHGKKMHGETTLSKIEFIWKANKNGLVFAMVTLIQNTLCQKVVTYTGEPG